MANPQENYTGIQPDSGAPVAKVAPGMPEPPTKLNKEEQALWDYITSALFEYGLIHKTDGLAISIICQTYNQWVEAEKQLAKIIKDSDKKTFIVSTPNGYQQPHQLYYVARNLKKELLTWLPEAALTIPSFQKAVSDLSAPQQGALFDDPVDRHRKSGQKIGLVVITGGKPSDQ